MKFIRILNTLHYDPRKHRFTSLAFKNSTSDGISVMQKECVLAQSQGICQHIEQFYPPPTSSDPPIFWEIDEAILPAGFQLQQQTSASGDICHYNLLGIADKVARDMLICCQLNEFRICVSSTVRPLTASDLARSNITRSEV